MLETPLDAPEVLVLVGSPREDGRCAKLAQIIRAELHVRGSKCCLYPLAKHPVAACNGCGSCMATGECVITGDGFGVLSRHMDSCVAAVVVAPVYFAGPSAWLKAALDRCQVYWSRRYRLGRPMPQSRPAHLLAVGEGGDPFGFDPLAIICKSALNSTGLRITDERVHDFVGENYDLARVATVLDQLQSELARN